MLYGAYRGNNSQFQRGLHFLLLQIGIMYLKSLDVWTFMSGEYFFWTSADEHWKNCICWQGSYYTLRKIRRTVCCLGSFWSFNNLHAFPKSMGVTTQKNYKWNCQRKLYDVREGGTFFFRDGNVKMIVMNFHKQLLSLNLFARIF